MVNISPILKAIPYVQGKTDEEIRVAVAAAGVPHPEKVKIVTGFINNLINLEIGKLEKDASNPSDAKAQHEAQQSLIKYHTNSPVALVNEVADTLTKNIFIVQELIGRDCEGYPDFDKTYAEGLNNIEQSTEVLLHSAIDIVNSKLSGYSTKIDTNNLQQSAKALVQELRNPPKPKSQTTINGEADSLTETAAKTVDKAEANTKAQAESPVNREKILADITNFTKEISNLGAVKALLKKDNGLETLSALNTDLSNLIPKTDTEAYNKALLSFETNYEQNKTFINKNISDSEKFKTEFNKLDDEEKIQIQSMLKNLELTTKHTITVKEIAGSAQEIKQALSGDSFQQISSKLNNLKENSTNENQGNNLDTVNNLLKEFNKSLQDIEANNQFSKGERINKKDEAIEAFTEKLSTEFKQDKLSISDIELIEERLDPNKKETAEQSQKAITERVLKNLNLSEEQLKGFAGIAVAAVVGLMVFCPNAIGNLVKTGTGLAAMAAQTLPMLFQAQAMMQMSKNGNDNGTASSQAA
jgi:hypothetical protein